MIIEQLGPLLYPGRALKHGEVQRRLDAASSVLEGYISSSLAKGGLNPKPVRCVSSSPSGIIASLWLRRRGAGSGRQP